MNEIPTIRPTANSPEGVLPIRDHAGLRECLAGADAPTLLMVYTHLSGDDELMQRCTPHIKPMMEGGANIPPPLRTELEGKLFAVLTRDPPVLALAPDHRRMQKMMSAYVGEPVDDEFVPLVLE